MKSGSRAHWDDITRIVRCAACAQLAATTAAAEPAGDLLERGNPGASAAREYRRRRGNREMRTRAAHPRIGGLLLALRSAPQHELAFRQGELGERAVAASLQRRTASGPAVVLADRLMPGGRGNIDLLAIAPSGVYVIDAKAITGEVRISRPLFGPDRLLVAGRTRTKLVDGLDRQVAAVCQALASARRSTVPVHGVLCFTKADLTILGGRRIRGHRLLHERGLARLVNGRGALTQPAIDDLARTLASAFPVA